MKYKLVALDLDDTLLNKEHELTSRTISVIKRIQNMGVNVILATGRMLVSAIPFVEKLGLKGPVITYNGAYVKDITTDELIYHNPIKVELAREVIKTAESNSLHLNLYQDDQLFVVRRNKEVRRYERVVGIKAREVGSLIDFIKKKPVKIIITEHDRERHQHYLNVFQEKFTPRLTITQSKDYFIEIMSGGISKGRALEVVAERLKIGNDEVVAIGDSWNDLEMITWAGLGIAMEDAAVEIKKKADLIAPSHNDDGVARILTKIFDL